jgi:hypothetical protein
MVKAKRNNVIASISHFASGNTIILPNEIAEISIDTAAIENDL